MAAINSPSLFYFLNSPFYKLDQTEIRTKCTNLSRWKTAPCAFHNPIPFCLGFRSDTPGS